jgi:hypothetical protein
MPFPTSKPVVLVVERTLEPREVVAGWRPAARTLSLSVREPVRNRQRVQARISLVGLDVSATVTGRARAVRHHSAGAELELELDPFHERVLDWLVEVARGARVDFQRRAPRYEARVPAVVYPDALATFMTTVTVSEQGCALAWTGPMPDLGAPVELRLGSGRGSARFCAEVRWTAFWRGAPGVGLRFAGGDHAAWTRLLDALRRRGDAPPA